MHATRPPITKAKSIVSGRTKPISGSSPSSQQTGRCGSAPRWTTPVPRWTTEKHPRATVHQGEGHPATASATTIASRASRNSGHRAEWPGGAADRSTTAASAVGGQGDGNRHTSCVVVHDDDSPGRTRRWRIPSSSSGRSMATSRRMRSWCGGTRSLPFGRRTWWREPAPMRKRSPRRPS
jgi:hypothetical protein